MILTNESQSAPNVIWWERMCGAVDVDRIISQGEMSLLEGDHCKQQGKELGEFQEKN